MKYRVKNPDGSHGPLVDIPVLRGSPGKSAFEYAKEGGFGGTEAEFAAKLAAEMPSKLPNPKPLTINGKTYDGSAAVNVTIDAGDLIPAYVRTEAERLAAVVQSRKNPNAVTFLACSDLHHSFEISNADQQTESLRHMGQAMGIVREQVQIDFASVLGDLVWDHGESIYNALRSMRYANSCLHAGFNGIPNLRDRGNHDCLYNGAGLTDSQIYANIFAYNTGAVFGDRTAGYCYRDFENHKLRVICINTCESNTGAFMVSDAQIAWLQSVLDLSSKGDGWRSIVLGHHPPDWVSSSSKLVQTLKAASGLIAVFHGHVHGFKVDTIPGTEITRIAIPNACFGRENEYGQNSGGENAEGTEFGEETSYKKTAGTAQDTAFCVVTIDLEAKKIYADHYGAGYSRVIPYDDVVLNSYTVTKNLTNVYISNAAVTVTEGTSYTAVLTAAQGYELDVVTVTMGGVDITSAAYNGGVVSIQSVTGDVVIMATATEVVEPAPPAEDTYTNLVRTSQDANGGIYNSTGYQTGYRLNSSGTTTAAAGAINCGFIPYSGEVIRVYGSTSGTQGTTGNYVAMYDAGHNKIGVYDFAGWVSNGGIWEAVDGKYMLTVDPVAITNATMQSTLQDAKYIRCSMALCTADDFVVTLDEPIE